MYLVDTNVLSASAPSRREAQGGLNAWMDAHSDALFLSVVTVAEVQEGIAKSRREGAARKAAGLEAWLETVLHLYGARILPLDPPTARVVGVLSDRARGLGQAPGLADIIIASTAKRHGLTILSRNLRHFFPLDVPALDPFLDLPQAR